MPTLHPEAGPRVTGAIVLIVALLQFLVVQLVVGSAWSTPYSWATNNVSDLGNLHCGSWGPDARFVCSPWHDLMNGSFVLTGIGITVGAVLPGRGRRWPGPVVGLIAFVGAGYVLAGLFPADADENMHVLGALIIFAAGSPGLLILAARGRGVLSPSMRRATLVAALVGTACATLFLARFDIGIGLGWLERIPAYLPALWLAVVALVDGRGPRRSPAGGQLPQDWAEHDG